MATQHFIDIHTYVFLDSCIRLDICPSRNYAFHVAWRKGHYSRVYEECLAPSPLFGQDLEPTFHMTIAPIEIREPQALNPLTKGRHVGCRAT